MDESTIIISSNVPNYQAFFESHFSDYLKKLGASTKTQNNYRTDVRYFLRWTSTIIQKPTATKGNRHVQLLNSISASTVQQFKAHLLYQKTPIATINRRLSALRSFFRFCIVNGWINENPAYAVRNLTRTENKKETINHGETLVSGFTEFLSKEGSSAKTRNNYRTDLRHFIQWATLTIQTHNLTVPSGHIELARSFTPQLLTSYKSMLREKKTPIATINRRLSALRSFFRFCIVNGWINENPAYAVRNVGKTERSDQTMQQMLASFKAKLRKDGIPDDSARIELDEIKQFLLWVNSRT